MIDTPRVRKQTRHYNSFEDDELMEFSELDSDSEERPCRTRRLSDRNRRYLRAECFRVEKNLLIFGSVLLLFGCPHISSGSPSAALQQTSNVIKSSQNTKLKDSRFFIVRVKLEQSLQ